MLRFLFVIGSGNRAKIQLFVTDQLCGGRHTKDGALVVECARISDAFLKQSCKRLLSDKRIDHLTNHLMLGDLRDSFLEQFVLDVIMLPVWYKELLLQSLPKLHHGTSSG